MKLISNYLWLLLPATALASCYQGTKEDDLIKNLTGLGPINFNHYSGYLNATDSRCLHYWLTESQTDPARDPLVLWLNGGPGCSSLLGLLTELGPFYLKDNKTLLEREYSWNKKANVLFLESPACVGFSYIENNGSCFTNDNHTAKYNYLALQDFFKKFPEYKDREFYITGESYAGVYIPTLSYLIYEGKESHPYINFKGYAIGNGLLGTKRNSNTQLFYAHYHGIIDDNLWHELVDRCCEDKIASIEKCDFLGAAMEEFSNSSALCLTSIDQALLRITLGGINPYNIYGDCDKSSNYLPTKDMFEREMLFNHRDDGPDLSGTPCTVDDVEVEYLNQEEVREALHISPEAKEWQTCSRLGYRRNIKDSTVYIKKLAEAGIRGLIYNGDSDMVCNFLGNQLAIEELGLKTLGPQRNWWLDGQVAGYVKYFYLLDLLTIRGAGHMVPEDKPKAAFEMITHFIENKPYPDDAGQSCFLPRKYEDFLSTKFLSIQDKLVAGARKSKKN